MKNDITLSVIIPTFNEADRLPNTLPKVIQYLEKQSFQSEILIVDNGSTDGTSKYVTDIAKYYDYIRLFRLEERGKGIAVAHGMLQARGAYRFMCDADLSTPIEMLDDFLEFMKDGYDIVIGSREVIGAKRINEPLHRHLIGRIANILIRTLILPKYHDTQCGFKLFSASSADQLFQIQKLRSIGFDVEILFLAQKHQYAIYEMPVTWYYSDESRIRLFRDSLAMFLDILTVRRTWKAGGYASSL